VTVCLICVGRFIASFFHRVIELARRTGNGSISGTVMDKAGADAAARRRRGDTQAGVNSRSAKPPIRAILDKQGLYSFRSNPLAHYEFTTMATGFNPAAQSRSHSRHRFVQSPGVEPPNSKVGDGKPTLSNPVRPMPAYRLKPAANSSWRGGLCPGQMTGASNSTGAATHDLLAIQTRRGASLHIFCLAPSLWLGCDRRHRPLPVDANTGNLSIQRTAGIRHTDSWSTESTSRGT